MQEASLPCSKTARKLGKMSHKTKVHRVRLSTFVLISSQRFYEEKASTSLLSRHADFLSQNIFIAEMNYTPELSTRWRNTYPNGVMALENFDPDEQLPVIAFS